MKGSVPSFLEDKSPATSVGSSFPMPKAETVEDAVKKDNDLYLTDRLGLRTHSTQATFADQYDHPELIKRSAVKFDVFRLDNEEDRKRYTELLDRTQLPAPKVELYTVDRQFYRGVFHIYVEYMDVLYQLPEKK